VLTAGNWQPVRQAEQLATTTVCGDGGRQYPNPMRFGTSASCFALRATQDRSLQYCRRSMGGWQGEKAWQLAIGNWQLADDGGRRRTFKRLRLAASSSQASQQETSNVQVNGLTARPSLRDMSKRCRVTANYGSGFGALVVMPSPIANCRFPIATPFSYRPRHVSGRRAAGPRFWASSMAASREALSRARTPASGR
jgi:hypothetical protein